MKKAEIRKKILKLRKRLSRKKVAVNSAEISKKLLKLKEFQTAKKIMFYSDFKNEVATDKMINKTLGFLKERKKQVFLPKVVKNKIVPVQIETLKDMVCGKFGILEPSAPPDNRRAGICFATGEPTRHLLRHRRTYSASAICQIDVVIVPGVVFDRKCSRVGWGKGYYDSFLKNTDVIKIGLAHSCQVVKKIPAGKNDVPMNFVITEKQVFIRNTEQTD